MQITNNHLCICVCIQRQRDRQTDGDRQRERESHRERQRQRDRQRDSVCVCVPTLEFAETLHIEARYTVLTVMHAHWKKKIPKAFYLFLKEKKELEPS